MSLFRRCAIHPLGENSSIKLTLFDSICKIESSDLVDNLSWLILTAKKKNQEDVYKKPTVKKFTPPDTGKLLRTNLMIC